MKEDLKITSKTVFLYPSYKWCLEYLLNWSIESIKRDQQDIKQYLQTLDDEDNETEEESMKMVSHLVELTHRLTGADYAIKAIKENNVQDQITKLEHLISDIEKEIEK